MFQPERDWITASWRMSTWSWRRMEQRYCTALIICNNKYESVKYCLSRHFIIELEYRTLQRTNTEKLKQIFPEKEWRGHSPNFHIHVSVSDLSIPTIYLPIPLQEICGVVDPSWEYINRSQTYECGNWDWGRAIPRKGIHKRNFRCSVEDPHI